MPDRDDPFFNMDEEHTIIKPNPGGRPAAPRPQQSPSQAVPEPEQRFEITGRPGLNRLEQAASVLLNLLSQIRNTSSHPNPTGLHSQLAREIQQFELNAKRAGVDEKDIFIARYAICTVIDEFVMSTPWGAGSIWSSQSLLSMFHKEVRGGERFFNILKKLQQDPGRNLEVLELLFVCLSLGFQGQYRVSPNGINELEQVRESLYYTIRNQREEADPSLSPHWEGLNKSSVSRTALIPAWMLSSIILLLMVGIYGFWRFNLNDHVSPVQVKLAEMGRNEEILLPARDQAPPAARFIADPGKPRFDLRTYLGAEISSGAIGLEEFNNRVELTIPGTGLFESGSEIIKPQYMDVLQKVAEGLAQANGRIKVIGHTDDVPMKRNQRFSNNFDLSQARADSVVRFLSQHLDNSNRLFAEGLGHTDPVASNATPAGRAQNRRVEIILLERARGS